MLRPASSPGAMHKPVVCYHCGHGHDVSAKAVSASCPRCYRQIQVGDVEINGAYWGARIQTCGSVVIGRKARVVTQLIRASVGVQVLGRFEGEVHTPGVVAVGSRGVLMGAVHARGVHIVPGGSLVGGPHVIHPDQVRMLERETTDARRGADPNRSPTAPAMAVSA